MLFLDDTEREFAEMLQFNLLLLIEARSQFARAEGGDAEEANEAEADEGVDLSANRHPGLTYHCNHVGSPHGAGAVRPSHARNWYMSAASLPVNFPLPSLYRVSVYQGEAGGCLGPRAKSPPLFRDGPFEPAIDRLLCRAYRIQELADLVL